MQNPQILRIKLTLGMRMNTSTLSKFEGIEWIELPADATPEQIRKEKEEALRDFISNHLDTWIIEEDRITT